MPLEGLFKSVFVSLLYGTSWNFHLRYSVDLERQIRFFSKYMSHTTFSNEQCKFKDPKRFGITISYKCFKSDSSELIFFYLFLTVFGFTI